MGAKTEIAWTDATWNPLRGCSRVSEGCRNCYAETVAARFSGPGQPYEGLATRSPGRWTGEVRLVEEHLTDPLRWKKPRRIFVNSMSDLFHERVPDEWIDRIFAVMALAPRHTFQVLTKRPERMLAYLRSDSGPRIVAAMLAIDTPPGVYEHPPRWPLPNVWLGVSVEDQKTADERVPLLLHAPAAIRFVSYEPALGPVDFTRWMPPGPVSGACACGVHMTGHLGCYGYCQDATGKSCDSVQCPGCGKFHSWSGSHTGNGRRNGQPLGQLIVGGESGPAARPFDLGWARSTIVACRAAGVACFVKQLGANARDGDAESWKDWRDRGVTRVAELGPVDGRLLMRDRKGADPAEWPEDLRVQEFPKEAP